MSEALPFTDMLGRNVLIKKPLKKVISLVPSQTEFLYYIHAGNAIAGKTIFCVHPETKIDNTRLVGGTKKVKFDIIDSISPDLIICNQEENTSEIVNKLSEKYPVWVSKINNLSDSYKMMRSLGEIFDSKKETETLLEEINAGFKNQRIHKRYSCIYLIWKKPYMLAGKDTFINDMLSHAGFDNLIQADRYPEISAEEMAALNPELVLLSSEPYPFSEKHISEIRKILPNSIIMTVNGELFSWYGSRLLNSQTYFNELQRQLHKNRK